MCESNEPIPARTEHGKREPFSSVVQQLFRRAQTQPSDFRDHVEYCRQLGSRCTHITEFGVRRGVSTAAWLAAGPATLVCYDLVRRPEVDSLATAAAEAGIAFHFHEADVRHVEIAETDLLFIDTLHTAEQLTAELNTHATRVRRHIVLHDTETFGTIGERGVPGLSVALEAFLRTEPDWQITDHRPNCHGLTVLTRGSGRSAR